MPQGVTEQRNLPVIEIRTPEHLLGAFDLSHLALEVTLEFADCLHDDPELLHDEVRYVAIIRLCVEEGTIVPSPMRLKDPRYSQKLRQPVPLRQYRPVEQHPRGTSISVREGVIISQPKMEHYRPHHRVEKSINFLTVGESAHLA